LSRGNPGKRGAEAIGSIAIIIARVEVP